MATRRTPHPTPARPHSHGAKRRELSQNFLRDHRVAVALCDQLGASSLPVIDLGAGSGALTAELLTRRLDVTAVELDPRWVATLRRRFGDTVDVVQADMLRFRFPGSPHNIVSNVPYSITTALLRRLLSRTQWRVAVLMVQWEVARKRSAPSLLTASWWPWYDLELVRRVPATAFRPVPRVDGGIVRLARRPDPMLADEHRRAYQHIVAAVFTGRGAGISGILQRHVSRSDAQQWIRANEVNPAALPRELTASNWVSLYRLTSRR